MYTHFITHLQVYVPPHLLSSCMPYPLLTTVVTPQTWLRSEVTTLEHLNEVRVAVGIRLHLLHQPTVYQV